MNTQQMYCPKCHKPLINGEKKRFETLCEHVEDPNEEFERPLRNTFICNNPQCPAFNENIFWDESGAMYGHNFKFKFDNDLNSAYPSFERKMDIEIYKKGLKEEKQLHPILTLYFLKPIIVYDYKADYWGNVVDKSWQLEWRKKEKYSLKNKNYCIGYTFPFVHIYKTIRFIRNHFKNKSILNYSDFDLKLLKDHFKPLPKRDKRWWRKLEKFLIKIIFTRLYLIYKSLDD